MEKSKIFGGHTASVSQSINQPANRVPKVIKIGSFLTEFFKKNRVAFLNHGVIVLERVRSGMQSDQNRNVNSPLHQSSQRHHLQVRTLESHVLRPDLNCILSLSMPFSSEFRRKVVSSKAAGADDGIAYSAVRKYQYRWPGDDD